MNRKQIISQAFGKRVTCYSKEASIQKIIAQNLANFLPQLHKANILEIGCGTGFLTTHLIKTYPDSQLVISDLSENMVSYTKENSPHHASIHFQVLDGENLHDELSQKFDVIISSMTVQWFSTPKKTLIKLQKLLKPRGVLLYSTLAPNCFPEWRQTLKHLSYPCGLITIDELPGKISEEMFSISHQSSIDFFRQLKSLGTSTPTLKYKNLTTRQFRKALTHMNHKHNACISWHIIYGRLYHS